MSAVSCDERQTSWRAARASRPRRTRPGCRPAPSTSCSPGASPSSRARRGRPRARPRRRRRGRRRRCRSRARRSCGPSPSRRRLYLLLVEVIPCSLTRSTRAGLSRCCGGAPRSRRGSRGEGSPGCPPRCGRRLGDGGRSSSGTPKSRSRSKPPSRASSRDALRPRRRRSRRRSARPRRARAAR